MSKHTPGPWRVGTDPGYQGYQITHETKTGYMVLAFADDDSATALANMKLMAAAPTLLKACKAISKHRGQLPGRVKQQLINAIAGVQA